MADVNAVHNVIQQIYHLRHNGGQRKLQQQLGYAAGAHILGFCGSHLQHSFKKAPPRIGYDAATDIFILLYMGNHYKPKPYS